MERIGEPGSSLTHQWSDRAPERRAMAVADHVEGMARLLEALHAAGPDGTTTPEEIYAVGHRVVHGGEEFTGAVPIDKAVIASIERFSDLAPLHNPPNLVGIRAATQALPEAQQVACFDTAFHMTLPQVAYMYALPYELYEKYGIRRYGFHGTSHRYVTARAAAFLGKKESELNVITCHLGNGCSMTAVENGRSVDTSMGLTPLEGLVMGTRTGDFDPAILFYLSDHGYDIASLNQLCNKQSGLIGISGQSNDMRTLYESASQDDARSQLAIDMFCYRIKKYVGAYLAVLGRVDAVVFTGGIGENAVDVRAKVCQGLDPLGIAIDPERNRQSVGKEAAITTPASRIAALVIPTDEEGEIAAETYQIVSPD